MPTQSMHPEKAPRVSESEQVTPVDPTTEAEREWSVRHARSFIIGLAMTILGFWIPVILGWYLWATHA